MRHAIAGFCTLLTGLFFATPAAFAGTPLGIVEVRAPDVNCIFDADCRITVSDQVSNIPVPAASGNGRLQSRTSPVGEPGTPGEGLYPYQYRIDLRQVGALTAAVCVDRLDVPFGPVETLDYNEDGNLEQVYVVTRGGLGSVQPSAAEITSGVVTFTFSPPVCPGSAPGNGESSFFFGLASNRPPQPVDATVGFNAGSDVTLPARAPGVAGGPGPGPAPGPILCEVGPFSLPIDPTTPACRCVQDRGAREFHCALPHPDFFAVWRVPFPVPPREPFRIEWTVMPRTVAGTDLEVEIQSAQGFQTIPRDQEDRPTRRPQRSGEVKAGGGWLVAPIRPGTDRIRVKLQLSGRERGQPVEVSLPVTIKD